MSQQTDQDSALSLWRRTAPIAPAYDRLSGKKSAEIVVIGGGFTGLSAALHCAEKGHDVALLEARDIGYGASGRNGGQVNPALPIATPDALSRAIPAPYAKRLADLSLRSADLLFDLIRRYNIDCDARQHGWIRCHHNERARKHAALSASQWRKRGAKMEMLDSIQTAKATGSAHYHSALLTKTGGLIHPLKLVQGLANAADMRGVSIYENSAIISISRAHAGWHIATNTGAIRADKVIFATNAYSAFFDEDNTKYTNQLRKTIMPLCPIQIATDPLPAALAQSILPQGQSLSDSRRLIIYARREPDNRIIYGSIGQRNRDGTLTGFDWLKKDAVRIFPQLEGVDWPYQWGGQIALTDNRLPQLLKLSEGVIAGLGYNGRGVAFSHLMGQILADYCTGTKDQDLPLPVNPPTPYRGRLIQNFGLRFYMSFAKWLDWAEDYVSHYQRQGRERYHG